MGRPMPGFQIVLVDPVTGEPDRAAEGEICAGLDPERPVGLMVGYRDDAERNAAAIARRLLPHRRRRQRDADGYITYVGRADDVFKSSDYRISPFELESVLIEHPAVAEAAVVPAPDPRPALGAQGVRHAGRGALARGRAGRRDPGVLPASTWRRTSGSAGWSSPSCRRRSAARSAGSSCARAEASRGEERPPGEYREEDFRS